MIVKINKSKFKVRGSEKARWPLALHKVFKLLYFIGNINEIRNQCFKASTFPLKLSLLFRQVTPNCFAFCFLRIISKNVAFMFC